MALAQAAPAMAPVPTTKVLAIGHITGGAPDPQAMRAIMPNEVRDTVNLYLAGKLDQWFVRQDTNGVVFLLNATSVADATEMLSKLPLVKAKRMEFDLIPLGPLSPLRYLLGDPASAAKP
jgi:hypothetical protein